MRRLVLIAALIFVVLPACGKKSNINAVKDGTMPGHESTTVGKAFEGSFDNCKWDAVETEKGKQIVVFRGNISKKTHDSVIDDFVARLDHTFGPSNEIQSQILLFEYSKQKILGKNFQPFSDGKGSAFFDRLNTELGCSLIALPEGGNIMPRCPSPETTQTYINKTNEESMRLTWEVGTPVEVKWSVNVDRKSFNLEEMSNNSWEGFKFEVILNQIYK